MVASRLAKYGFTYSEVWTWKGAEIVQESIVPRTADGQQACGQACVAPPSKSRAKRRSWVGCGAALGAAVRGARDAAVRRPSSSSPTNGYMPGRLKLHVMCNFGYLLGIAEGPPARRRLENFGRF